MTAVTQIPEKIAEKKIIVYKSRLDPAKLKLKAEEMKNELFVKRFQKPRPEDIRVVSVDKHYVPYALVDAQYRIEYYTKKTYNLEVDEKAKEVKILGKTFTPQTLVIPNTEPTQFKKVVAVEGQEWAFYEAKAYIILDKTGREILPDQVPIAPSEDNPTKLLKEFKNKTEHLKLSNKELVTMVKDKLINKPSDIDTIDNELFQISEHAVIYNPIYVITFQNVKTKEEKSVHIDGVTGDIIV
ncbi:MAG: hypothetical protein IAX21_05880 [Candidatus Bathyarchaeota archaeon]|nr:hypothetical protein [Candidatus Bathyarchaeum tardum]WGM89517.1 MAG: hypothetical protein NUK63_11565 [Candidatus Bathyarchaeum tardum]WNZ28212.1 MAG: hypothetical protein IAX21_05880 [Candidatus Bathyarchaeota archaeon]